MIRKSRNTPAKWGVYLEDGLKKLAAKHDVITEVRGKGLLLAVRFKSEIAEPVMLACLENGLLVNNVKAGCLEVDAGPDCD